MLTDCWGLHRIDLSQSEPEATLFRRIELKGLNADDFETAQHFVSSRDGTRVPMFIVQKKGAQRDGNNPTLLYGYGGAAADRRTVLPVCLLAAPAATVHLCE